MGAGRKKKHEELARQNETQLVCEQIIDEARRITESGKFVVLTTAEDKRSLSVAMGVRESILAQLNKPETEPPRTSSGVRFSAL